MTSGASAAVVIWCRHSPARRRVSASGLVAARVSAGSAAAPRAGRAHGLFTQNLEIIVEAACPRGYTPTLSFQPGPRRSVLREGPVANSSIFIVIIRILWSDGLAGAVRATRCLVLPWVSTS